MNIVRESKFRFVFGELSKPEFHITNIPLSDLTGDNSYITGNPKYFAVPIVGGGGPVLVYPHDKGVHLPSSTDLKILSGHKSRVLELQFDPFDDERIATGSEDTTIRIWKFPVGGLTENITDSVILEGHTRKILSLEWNSVAKNVLASAAGDYNVKIWDVESQTCNITLNLPDAFVQCLSWNNKGDKLAISTKDKKIRVWEPLTNKIHAEWQAHESVRTSKCCWAGDKVITTGFNKLNSREIKLWNPEDTSAPLKTIELDRGSGVLFPYFDEDLGLLYICGKGDSSIYYFELTHEEPYLYRLDRYLESGRIKGFVALPKRACDVMKCEILRVLKLTEKSVEPISFCVPRRSNAYQDDLYPDCLSGISTCESTDWFDGNITLPKRMSLDPNKTQQEEIEEEKPKRKTYKELEDELKDALERITVLEKENEELRSK